MDTQSSLISQHDLLTAHKPSVDVGERDNPPKQTTSIHIISSAWEKGNIIKAKYTLRDTGLATLIRICVKWSEGKPSTAYALSVKAKKIDITQVCTQLVRLRDKGLIEVVGSGYKGCNTWAPTKLGQSVINWLCEV